MNHATGFYSIIQYCPDLSRLESANIGVLLFCPQRAYLRAKMSPNNKRVRQFFGLKGQELQRVKALKKGIEERIQVESETIHSPKDLEAFIARRANHIQLTLARPMRVADPDKDLDELYRELVADVEEVPNNTSYKRYLGRRFLMAGLGRKIQPDVRVTVPVTDRVLDVPFGFQNGRFNLIQPASFKSTKSVGVISTASRYAVEGRSLYEHRDNELGDLQLLVLGQFSTEDGETKKTVRHILGENKVALYTSENLDQLIDEIQRTAKDVRGRSLEDSDFAQRTTAEVE